MARKIKQLTRRVLAAGTAVGSATVQAYSWTIPETPPTVLPTVYTTELPKEIDLRTSYSNIPVGSNYAFSLVSSTPESGVTVSNDGRLTVPLGTVTDTYTVTVDLTDATAVALPTLGISGAGAWTFGHAFADADTTPNEYIAATNSGGGSVQVEIRNRWASGRPKFAVVSGTLPGTVTFTPSSSAPAAGEVALSSSPASVTFTGAVTGSYACPTTNTVEPWSKSTAHLVRKIVGPVMTERHYYVPTTDAHVAVWFHVRSYSNGATWVETIVENGWARVASPAERAYGVTVSVGGSTRYTASLAHYSHTRWSRQDWVGTNPGSLPKHDAAYLKRTKLVPNYAPQLTAETTLAGLPGGNVASPAPFTRYGFEVNGASGGDAPWLAILPRWDVAYIQTGDVRAYRSMLANEQASNCCFLGSDHNIVRDEATGLPPALTSFYSESWSNGYSPTYGTGKVTLGVNSTVNPESGVRAVWRTDGAHAWNAGYLPYLVTGRWFSLETCQMHAVGTFLNSGIGGANPVRPGEDRACAWDFRSYSAALAVTPDDQATVRAAFKNYLETYLAWWRPNEVLRNNLGVRQNIYNNVDYGPAPYNTCGAFQQYFITQAFAWGRDVASHIVGATAQTQWTETAQFHGRFTTGLLGTRPDGHCFRRAGTYGIVIGPDRTVRNFFNDFGELYAARVTTGQVPSGEACALTGADSTLLYGSDDPYNISGTSYFGNMVPAAAYAVDVGTSGASDAWARLTGSASWPSFYANWAIRPEYGVLPR